MTDLPKFNVLTTDHAIGSKGKKMENLKMESTNSRRTFLKKVAYVAPAVIVLGGLSAQAKGEGEGDHRHKHHSSGLRLKKS
jgi:hypothetical protein